VEQLANNASTTLNGSINNSVTSVVVTDGSVFPSSGNYRLAVDAELLLVTARSGNTLTALRGQEGTATSAHANGSLINLLYTKGSFEQIIADYEQVGGWASRPSTARKGTVYTANDFNARWWYNGTGWDLIHPVYVPVAKQWNPAGWTARNQSTAVFTNRNGILDLWNVDLNSGNDIRGYSKALPTPPYTANWIVGPNPWATQANSMYLGVRENSSGRLKVGYVYGEKEGQRGTENWSSYNAFNSDDPPTIMACSSYPTWFRFQDDNTNWIISASADGKFYTPYKIMTRNSFMVTAADQIFFGLMTRASLSYISNVMPNMYIYAYWEG
jgi:hypothetical protein